MSYRLQSGQALIPGLAVLLVGLLSLLFLFNAGLAVRQKAELTNAADAGALAAGLEQARAMNFIAYANRGIVANEIAVGQAVALQSWSRALEHYLQVAPSQVPRVCGAVIDWVQLPQMCLLPYLGMNSFSSGLFTDALAPAALKAQSELWPALVSQSGQAQQALAAAQAAMAGIMTTPVYLKGPVMAVARKNLTSDAGLGLDEELLVSAGQVTAQSSWNFQGQSVTHTYQDQERQHLTDSLIRRAAMKDEFLASRNWTAKNLVASLGLDCLTFFKKGLPAVEINRRGGTRLNGIDDWESVDTIQGNIRYAYIPKRKILPRCGFDSIPINGGGATSNEESFDYQTENWAAQASFVQGQVITGKHRLANFVDLQPSLLANNQAVRPRVVIRITQASRLSGDEVSPGAAKGAGRLQLYDQPLSSRPTASAVAAAEVYFDPAYENGQVGQVEDSLLSPFWAARLVELSPTERALLLQRQGGLGL